MEWKEFKILKNMCYTLEDENKPYVGVVYLKNGDFFSFDELFDESLDISNYTFINNKSTAFDENEVSIDISDIEKIEIKIDNMNDELLLENFLQTRLQTNINDGG